MQFKFKTTEGDLILLDLASVTDHTYRINRANGTITLKYQNVPEFTVAAMPRTAVRRKKVAEFILHVDDWVDADHAVPADMVFAPQMQRFASNIVEAFQFNFDVEVVFAPKGTIQGISDNSRVVTFLVSAKGKVGNQYKAFIAKLKSLSYKDFGSYMPENTVDHLARGVLCTYFNSPHSIYRASMFA